MEKKVYLGDSVYAQFDGWCIILTTENGLASDPSNTIFLEPKAIDALNLFYRKTVAEWIGEKEQP